MIVFENVCKTYSGGSAALDNINLHIYKGEFVFIVGPSGAGKSTLIKLLLNELAPNSGRIFINGKNISKIRKSRMPYFRRSIGVIFQDFRLLEDRNVFDNVAFAQKVIEAPTKKIRERVMNVLSVVNLCDKAKAKPMQLAGGEQQRVAIARALINQPDILLADEPTGNLDETNAWDVMKFLIEASEDRGTTVVVVTHNMDMVRALKKRTITIEDGIVKSDIPEGEYE